MCLLTSLGATRVTIVLKKFVIDLSTGAAFAPNLVLAALSSAFVKRPSASSRIFLPLLATDFAILAVVDAAFWPADVPAAFLSIPPTFCAMEEIALAPDFTAEPVAVATFMAVLTPGTFLSTLANPVLDIPFIMDDSGPAPFAIEAFAVFAIVLASLTPAVTAFSIRPVLATVFAMVPSSLYSATRWLLTPPLLPSNVLIALGIFVTAPLILSTIQVPTSPRMLPRAVRSSGLLKMAARPPPRRAIIPAFEVKNLPMMPRRPPPLKRELKSPPEDELDLDSKSSFTSSGLKFPSAASLSMSSSPSSALPDVLPVTSACCAARCFFSSRSARTSPRACALALAFAPCTF